MKEALRACQAGATHPGFQLCQRTRGAVGVVVNAAELAPGLSILAGRVTVAEAARRAKVSEQSAGTGKRQFLEAEKSAEDRLALRGPFDTPGRGDAGLEVPRPPRRRRRSS